MVQTVDNRLPLSSVDSDKQLSEFQLVHAIITQSGKTTDDNSHSNNRNNTRGVQNTDSHTNRPKREFFSKDEKSVLQRSVMTICNTFNALAQATNPSLCAKQNKLHHPINLASTVKRIISQFSRPCHGPLCLASPSEISLQPTDAVSSVRSNNAGNRAIHKQDTVVRCTEKHPTSPSGATTHIARRKEDNKSPPKPNPTIGQKVKPPRHRNAYGLTRHVSAPIPFPREAKEEPIRPSTSVKRSKSDCSNYATYYRRSKTKIDSNVKTKVQHFENCCKDKGKGAMCLECEKHSLEQEESLELRVSPEPTSIQTQENPDNYIGALSYHKPSTISQSSPPRNSTDCCNAVVSSPSKVGPPTAPRTKSVACPGGVYYPPGSSDTPVKKQEDYSTADVLSSQDRSASPDSDMKSMEVMTSEPTIPPHAMDDSWSDPGTSSSTPEVKCPQMKRKHSFSDDDTQSNKKESRDNSYGDMESPVSLCNIDPEIDNHEPCSNAAIGNDLVTPSPLSTPNNNLLNPDKNLYSFLSINDVDDDDTHPADADVAISLDVDQIEQPSTLNLSLPLEEEPTDSLDDNSSSCSNESCPSPRESYLARCERTNSLHRRPSNRYQRIRRKLKRLLGRPQSYPEALPMEYCFNSQSQEEQEQIYLESIRIPAPLFMLRGSHGSINFRRQQLAFQKDHKDWMSALPDNVMLEIFSYLDTRSLANLKCVCKDFSFLIDTYDIRGTDSMWVRDERYMDDPCKFCRRRFTCGDVSMCRYHSKTYHCDLPYGRSYWICCFKIERNAPGCKTGIHNNDWRTPPMIPK